MTAATKPRTPARETKSLTFNVKATGVTTSDDGQEFGQLECYGAIFGNVDEGGDRINKGAFTRTIQNSKARAQNRQKKYVLPILWQHDTNELIGGWYDLLEDNTGLLCKGEIALATQRGREYYALAKAGMSDQFSIIYDVPSGGAKYDKSGVRDLTELRLFSIDVVTFAMNDETKLIGVKSMDWQTKAITGNTSGPIGPRDESWDGGKAEKQIWSAAVGDDGDIAVATAKKYFMVMDGDGSQKGDYSYPFWYVGSDPHICVGAVKAIAGAISGSRGADAPNGLKAKVETLYSRINKKYPDDPQLTAPWKSGGDGKSMNNKPKEKKTLLEHWCEEMCEDLLEDWKDVYTCSLTGAIFDALAIGDEVEKDVSQALDDFKTVVLEKFVAQAAECDLSQYLQDHDYSFNTAASTMYNGADDGYGYMSRSMSFLQGKAGRSISKENQDNISAHVANVHDIANKAMTDMRASMKALHTAADDFANTMQGAEQPYDGDDEGTPDEGQQEGKSYDNALAELRGLRLAIK